MRRSWWGPASSSACGWARRRSRRRAVPGRASQSSTSSESWRDRPPAWRPANNSRRRRPPCRSRWTASGPSWSECATSWRRRASSCRSRHLALERLLLFAPCLDRQELALLLQLVAHSLQLGPLAVHLLLHGGLLLLELFAGRHAGGRSRQDSLDVDDCDARPGTALRRDRRRAHPHADDDAGPHHDRRIE